MLQGCRQCNRRSGRGRAGHDHRQLPARRDLQDLGTPACPATRAQARRLEAPAARQAPRQGAGTMSWLVITAGRGPAECHIAVASILDILLAEAKQAGLAAEMLDAEATPHGLASALVALEGDGVDRFIAG